MPPRHILSIPVKVPRYALIMGEFFPFYGRIGGCKHKKMIRMFYKNAKGGYVMKRSKRSFILVAILVGFAFVMPSLSFAQAQAAPAPAATGAAAGAGAGAGTATVAGIGAGTIALGVVAAAVVTVVVVSAASSSSTTNH